MQKPPPRRDTPEEILAEMQELADSFVVETLNEFLPQEPLTCEELAALRKYSQRGIIDAYVVSLLALKRAWGNSFSVDTSQTTVSAKLKRTVEAQKEILRGARSAILEVDGISDPDLKAFADASMRQRMGQSLTPEQAGILFAATDTSGAPLVIQAAGKVIWTDAGLAVLEYAMPNTKTGFFYDSQREQEISPTDLLLELLDAAEMSSASAQSKAHNAQPSQALKEAFAFITAKTVQERENEHGGHVKF
ncbi:hypothetical protein WJU23_10855 [Prosthecobacter sp. SYSU 5D2]|uniref:hypothetical protein n=1 Tax=Prosthecobacter sp. SYSU 5D2 TaxID=3134134 RepID=UPI0031FF32C6